MADAPDAPAASRLTEADVRHVAKLARLSPPAELLPVYAEQLGGILDYVAHVGEVDVDGVEPTAHAVTLVNVLRDDRVGEQLTVDQALQNAPDSDPPFFKVPKVLGGDEDSAG